MRQRVAVVLAVLAALCGAGALIAGYLDRAVVDSGRFANRATASLDDPAVRDFVGARVTEALVAQQPDLVAFQPLIRGAAGSVAGSAPFRSIFRASVRDVHRTVVEGDRDTVLLTLNDIGTVVQGALDKLNPTVAGRVDAGRGATIVDDQLAGPVADGARGLRDLRVLWLVLGFVALLLAGGALALAGPARRSVVVWLGGALAASSLLGIAALGIARGRTLDSIGDPGSRAAAAGLWAAVFGDLRTSLLLLAAGGLLIAAAAASLIRPVELDEPLRRAWAWVVTRPQRTRPRIVRAVVLLAAGVLTVADPGGAAALAATVAGALLIVGAVSEILRISERPAGPVPVGAGGLRRALHAITPRILAVGGLALAALVLALALVTRQGGIATPPAPPIERCNGHAALCDRRLDEVAFAATHNSMSAANQPDWLFAQQDAGIRDQLADGIHGLLIDTHYGFPVNGRVKTDLELDAASRAKFEQELGKEGLDAALRIRDRLLTGTPGPRGIYLCHALCELGAEPLATALRDLERYLTRNPHEVVVVVVEDAVPPEAFAAEVRRAGLEPSVYQGPAGPPWPTLRSMIADGGRVLMLAESGDRGVPWLLPAFRAMQETPFRFTRPELLTDPARLEASCEPNRGVKTATLFQLNHWIDTSPTPRPSNAKRVNAHDALLRRARTCQRQRDLFPGLLAVDFYRQGDLFGVVDELNGARPAPR